MFESLFQSTTIPVLEQVVNFAQARQNASIIGSCLKMAREV